MEKNCNMFKYRIRHPDIICLVRVMCLLCVSTSGIFLLVMQHGAASGKKKTMFMLLLFPNVHFFNIMNTMTNLYIFLNITMQEVPEGSADLIFTEEIDFGVCPEGKYFTQQFCLDCPAGHL